MKNPNDFDQIVATIKDCRRFLISSHINPDGDSVGSELALYHLLRALGKEVQVINQDPAPEFLRFLPGAEDILPPEQAKLPYDASFLLDCGQFDRTGDFVPRKSGGYGITINIDHHVTGSPWAELNWIDRTSSSTAEMIHRLINVLHGKPSLDMACCIYTGLLTDTGSFRHSNTSARALSLAASLVELGVDPARVAERLYNNIPYKTLRLLGLALETLGISDDGLVAWISIPRAYLQATGTSWEATEEFINYPRSIPSVVIALCFKETSDTEIKVSFRSRGRVDVAGIASRHGGGGHMNAAGCNMSGTLPEVMGRMIGEVRRELSRRRWKSIQSTQGG